MIQRTGVELVRKNTSNRYTVDVRGTRRGTGLKKDYRFLGKKLF